MGKVNDTESFIKAGRLLHGDAYDYSETKYVASQKPILFGCRSCGRTVQLSQAQSHIRKIKPCGGCRSCEYRRTMQSQGRETRCKCCRKDASYLSAGVCKECKTSEAFAISHVLKKSLTKKMKSIRRNEKKTGWYGWAYVKSAALCSRSKQQASSVDSKFTALKEITSWEKKMDKQRMKLHNGGQDKWRMKCAAWQGSLSRREATKKKPVDQN